ncbi:MAG TPA: polysaccharide deacetylase family protein [Cyanobacteria bacterium UBA8803]|nr:polysaccharide deacetylase family protein [Cyanobacteria bacterium UBA9273]HBL61868.1 polysaccharide deacetylase family protein [Cyanobacteria bacterium UBA8803]
MLRWLDRPTPPTRTIVKSYGISTLPPTPATNTVLTPVDKTPSLTVENRHSRDSAGKSEEFPVTSTPNGTAPSPDTGSSQSAYPITPPEPKASVLPSNSFNQEIAVYEEPGSTYFIPTQFHGKIVHRIAPIENEKVIALTFDDGPWPRTTSQVLDILKHNNIVATFFWVGQNLQAYPKIAQQVVADGHAIGNHTWHHSYRQMDRPTAVAELDKTAELIYKTTGIRTALFRPPGGILTNGVADYAKQRNYTIIMWSNDPMDYRPLSAKELVKNVIRTAKPGCIVLMHDGGGNHYETVKALPETIQELQKLGYRFVSVPELLELGMIEN